MMPPRPELTPSLRARSAFYRDTPTVREPAPEDARELADEHDALPQGVAVAEPGARSVAYLVNQYPKVSHTFIRREIEALERTGIVVERFSIRPGPDALRDPEDLSEEKRTRYLLRAGFVRIVAATLSRAIRHPTAFARASLLAFRVGLRSERGLLVHAVYLAEACLLLKWLSERSVLHVHAHFGTNPTTVAMLCRELGGPAFSFTVHGPEEFDKPSSIALAEKVKRASFVVAISSFGRSQLYRLARFEHWNKIHVVRCGVGAPFLDGETEGPPNSPRLVCVGRLCEQKGQLLLLEAAAELRRQGERFELVLVGDGEMKDELVERIREHGLGEHVRITGWVDGDAVRNEIVNARALILPSFAEGLPLAIIEALALSRPVVSTFVAGIPELVEPGKTGWLVPAGSVTDLAAAMRSAMRASSAEIREMGEAGRARVRAQHDVRTSARLLADLLGESGSDADRREGE